MTIFILGEHMTEEDHVAGGPFASSLGYVLHGILRQLGIDRDECYLTNVFMTPKHDISAYCGDRFARIPGLPPITRSLHVSEAYRHELIRLYEEIERVDPKVILALGPAAAWAVLANGGVKQIRGAAAPTSDLIPRTLSAPFAPRKVIATYSPATIRKDWTLRPVVVSDVAKAKRESLTRALVRPARHIWIEPTLMDLEDFESRFFAPDRPLGVDIETRGGQITCIGFSPSPREAIVIPFWSSAELDGNYWRNPRDELTAWAIIRRWLATYPADFQNGLYDMHYLWKVYGIPTLRAADDTMLLHHALQPEMQKGLGFLATIYTDEASWKFMRKIDTLKKEE